jgi:hypothetical protein
VKALLAGNDILLLPVDIKKAVSKIKAALREGVLSQEEVDRKVKKILMYKQFYNIHRTRPVEVAGIQKHLHNPGSEKVIRQIAAEAVTVINNKNNLLPLRRPDTMRIAALATGVGEKQVFQDYLDFYGPVTHFFTGKNISDDERDDLLEKLKDYDLILLSVHNTSSFPFRDFGISESERSLADSLAARQRVVLTIFGIPYALSQFIHPAKYDGLIVADTSGRRLINDYYNMGLNIKKAHKQEKVEQLKHLKGWKLVVDPNSPDLIEAFNNYSWHDKKSGIVKHDYSDLMDSWRYAAYDQINPVVGIM